MSEPHVKFVDAGPCYQCGHTFAEHRFSDEAPEPCAAPGCACAYYWIKLSLPPRMPARAPELVS